MRRNPERGEEGKGALEAREKPGAAMVRGPRRRTSCRRPACRLGRRTGERRAGLPPRRRPAGEAAGRGSARAGAAEPEQAKSPLHRAEPPASSSPSCSPPRRDAKARGCCTRGTPMWKPWTAPPCFFCSRPFLCSSPRLPRHRPGPASPALRPLRCRVSTPPPRRRVLERETRRRLRAGLRAEPVDLQVPLPSSPRALPCSAIVSCPCPDERTPSFGSPSAPTH
jgi:hypothetical protein